MRRVIALGTLALLFAAAPTVLAQPAPATRPTNGMQGMRMDPKAQQLARIKQTLALDDAKWADLNPKIEKALDAIRAAQSGFALPQVRQGRGGFGQGGPGGPGGGPGQGRPEGGERGQRGGGEGGPRGDGGPGGGGERRPDGGPGGQQPPAPPSPLRDAAEALRDTLEQQDATPEEIKAKVGAFHAEQAKANAALADARKQLRAAVDPKVEAQLTVLGVLD